VKLSISVTNFAYPGGPEALRHKLTTLAGSFDAAGLHTMWVSDHLLQADPFAERTDPMLEAYTTLGFLAASTARLRLGTMVSATTFRAPALLIKAVTTLDVLSAGRAWLGIGAGYNRDEAESMGLFLPPMAERFARLEETLQLAAHMWVGDDSPFHGAHLTLTRPVCVPRPVSVPRPRVLIGGTGPRRTLRLVAQYADACNFFDIPDGGATLRTNLELLADRCAEVGRDPDEIEHTVTTALVPDENAQSLAERCHGLRALGVHHVVLISRGRPWEPHDGDVLGAAADLLSAS
jgi:F420-dependent oxidoreductase-like protein